jgi:3-phosphoshikimate 1-carboxyvinyltransferase
MQRMGGDFQVESEREVQGEQVVDIRVRHRALRGAVVDADEVALAIDEIPIFSLAARCSVGESIVSGAGELRVKESDRISSLLLGYASMGIFFHEKPDGWEVVGPQEASAAELESHGDHRLAMTFILNALTAEGWWNIRGVESIATSYPQFFEHLEEVTGLSLLPGA